MHYLALMVCAIFAILVLEIFAFIPIRFLNWIEPPSTMILVAIALVLAWCMGD